MEEKYDSSKKLLINFSSGTKFCQQNKLDGPGLSNIEGMGGPPNDRISMDNPVGFDTIEINLVVA